MKVGCMEHEGTFEVEEESITYRMIVDSFKCPIYEGDAFVREIDVYKCFDCKLVWCVE